MLELLRARLRRLWEEFDGIRLDHPHGLVCPWVYRDVEGDRLLAVRQGARLFSSPDLPDHPRLSRYAIARPEQLDRALPRHEDAWVRELDDGQVRRYGLLFEVVVDEARRHHRPVEAIICEVLSTLPYPLRRVLERHGLGRFRVTQKANLEDPQDVYRSENARPEDWIMVGNHDTASIWLLVQQWRQSGIAAEQAAYLARRLTPAGADPALLQQTLLADPGALAHAKLADVFVSRSRHVMIFFADLFGLEERYNVPGTVNEVNWSLRLPTDYAERYVRQAGARRALHLPRVLAMALRARGEGPGGLAERLEASPPVQAE